MHEVRVLEAEEAWRPRVGQGRGCREVVGELLSCSMALFLLIAWTNDEEAADDHQVRQWWGSRRQEVRGNEEEEEEVRY